MITPGTWITPVKSRTAISIMTANNGIRILLGISLTSIPQIVSKHRYNLIS